jgi:hypothetical protein
MTTIEATVGRTAAIMKDFEAMVGSVRIRPGDPTEDEKPCVIWSAELGSPLGHGADIEEALDDAMGTVCDLILGAGLVD